MERFEMQVPEELLCRVDVVRGNESRASFFRRAVVALLDVVPGVEQTRVGRGEIELVGASELATLPVSAESPVVEKPYGWTHVEGHPLECHCNKCVPTKQYVQERNQR